MDDSAKLGILFPLFRGLDEKDLLRVSTAMRYRSIQKGDVVFHDMDHRSAVCLVFAGQLMLRRMSASGREIGYARFLSGSHVGEVAALDGLPRLGDVVALAHSEVGVIPGRAFATLADQVRPLAGTLLMHLCGRVRDLSARIYDQVALTVPLRVEAEILRLAVDAGIEANAALIVPPPTHAQLAALVGGQREAVTRAIGGLVRDDLVATRCGGLAVRDVRALADRVRLAG
ncbi:MAG TPA: Crp/Fnr family transcriptional regulator [Allosphingosinicella sp.]|nr:Crp/Fnr family transcriptional regulator [Allosphingosinicella sp.]